jgi:hypothetical protein
MGKTNLWCLEIPPELLGPLEYVFLDQEVESCFFFRVGVGGGL